MGIAEVPGGEGRRTEHEEIGDDIRASSKSGKRTGKMWREDVITGPPHTAQDPESLYFSYIRVLTVLHGAICP